MDLSIDTELINKFNSRLSLHTDEVDPDFDKHLNLPSGFPGSQDHYSESGYIESMMICNEVDIENELKKAKNEPESVFKMLSISFYDKSLTSRPSQHNNYSPLNIDKNNKMFTSRPAMKAPEDLATPVARHLSWNTVKILSSETPKMDSKPQVKLFSIREKAPNQPNLSPKSKLKKNELQLGLAPSVSGRGSPQTVCKEPFKEEKIIALSQTPLTLRKTSLTNNTRLNTLDTKVTDFYSPKSALKKEGLRLAMSDMHSNLVFNLSPRTPEPKYAGTPTLKKHESAKEPLSKQVLTKKSNAKEDAAGKVGGAPIGYTVHKNRLEYKLDGQRASCTEGQYSSNPIESHNKQNKNLSKKEKMHRASQSPGHYSNLLKVDLTKGYSYSKSHTKNISRKDVLIEPGSPKVLLKKTAKLNSEEEDKSKAKLKNLLVSPLSKNKSPKESEISWTIMRHRESSPVCGFSESSDNNKYNSKSKLKGNGKESSNGLELVKQRSAVLPFRCKTFEI